MEVSQTNKKDGKKVIIRGIEKQRKMHDWKRRKDKKQKKIAEYTRRKQQRTENIYRETKEKRNERKT